MSTTTYSHLPRQTGWGMPWPGAELAQQAEQAGAKAFCAGEFADHHSYLTVGEMVDPTEKALIGTSVAYAYARSPFIHATAARHLHNRAHGRIFLGLGSGTRRMNADWFASPFDPPLRRMEEMVGAIRAYLTAESMSTVHVDGELYPINAAIRAPVLGAIDVPILLGAFNQGMLGVAGRVCDGVIGHGLFTDKWWAEMIDPRLDAAAKSADRDPDTLHRWGWVITSIDDDDPERAERDARLMVAFYLTVKTYDRLVELHGHASEIAELREAFRRTDLDGMAEAVPTPLLDAIALYGSIADARDRFATRNRLPDLRFHSPPSFMVSPRRRDRYAQAIIEFCRSS